MNEWCDIALSLNQTSNGAFWRPLVRIQDRACPCRQGSSSTTCLFSTPQHPILLSEIWSVFLYFLVKILKSNEIKKTYKHHKLYQCHPLQHSVYSTANCIPPINSDQKTPPEMTYIPPSSRPLPRKNTNDYQHCTVLGSIMPYNTEAEQQLVGENAGAAIAEPTFIW